MIYVKTKIKENFCYQVTKEGLEPISYFSQNTNLYYKLVPTSDWPTITLGSVPMHRVKSPKQDTFNKIDLLKEIRELKNYLAYAKNIGFFFGAGTSCALKIPNIDHLTDEIRNRLETKEKKMFEIIKKDIS